MCRNARDPGELSPHKDIICCVSGSQHPTALSVGYYYDLPVCRRRLSNLLEVTWFIATELEFESGFLQSLCVTTSLFEHLQQHPPGPSLFLHSFSPLQSPAVLKCECASVTWRVCLGLAWDLSTCNFYISQVLLVQHPMLGTTMMPYN